jgi:hypothetical protein
VKTLGDKGKKEALRINIFSYVSFKKKDLIASVFI